MKKNIGKEADKHEIIISFTVDIFNRWIMAYCVIGKLSNKKIKEESTND